MPVERVTMVLPTERFVNMHGALMSYHSFLVNGSTLHSTQPHSLDAEEPQPRRHQTENGD